MLDIFAMSRQPLYPDTNEYVVSLPIPFLVKINAAWLFRSICGNFVVSEGALSGQKFNPNHVLSDKSILSRADQLSCYCSGTALLDFLL